MGGELRYLTAHSAGMVDAHLIPQDKVFNQFLADNRGAFPQLNQVSPNRWSLLLRDSTLLLPELRTNIQYRQVSDDYYLQDFSGNPAILTQNQILRQGDVTYTTDNWVLSGMLQSYLTLHPVTQGVVGDTYERWPQLAAHGTYRKLPMGATFNLFSQFDYFTWPSRQAPFYQQTLPSGPRYHLNPVLSLPNLKPWGYFTPSLELVENVYAVHYALPLSEQSFQRTFYRASVDSGLTFERSIGNYTQTLEPRLFYLNVPYRNQTSVPVYESGYMMFNTDQLFRTNRFAGFDRIGDANHLAYAVTSRFLRDSDGQEKASLTLGQIRYFSDRQVELCYQKNGTCADSPFSIGYLSPVTQFSPIAAHGLYHINSALSLTGDYVWDPYTRMTNSDNVNIHYQSEDNRIVSLGYTYLANTQLLSIAPDSALRQATLAYTTPLTDRWSSFGVYSYDISQRYSMLGFLGLQYENCCWAVRLMGGKTFWKLSPGTSGTLQPEYQTSVYFQVLLKGLGTVASSDPSTILRTYLPEMRQVF